MIGMSPDTFYFQYAPNTFPSATHLCYKVKRRKKLIDSGHLTNRRHEAHAEEVFIGERFRDVWNTCTIVWYISWSPCDKCIKLLLNKFLPNNPSIKLQIAFAKVYEKTSTTKIQQLYARGVSIRVMDLQDFRWCWDHFVDSSYPFTPRNSMHRNVNQAFQWLNEALYGNHVYIDMPITLQEGSGEAMKNLTVEDPPLLYNVNEMTGDPNVPLKICLFFCVLLILLFFVLFYIFY